MTDQPIAELTQTEVDLIAACASDHAPAAPDIESLCRDYAQRWLGQDWPAMDGNEKAYWRIEAYRWLKCWSVAEAAPRAINSCPCGAGEEPCPDAEGRPLCARSSVGSEQRTSNPQGAGSNPAERTNCPKCGRETCGCTFSAEAPTKPIGWLRTWLDGVCSFVSTSEKPQEVSGTTLTPLYTSSRQQSVTSTDVMQTIDADFAESFERGSRCRNCGDPNVEIAEVFCGTCREMGCALSSTERGGNTLTAEEKSDRAAALAQARAFTQADGGGK